MATERDLAIFCKFTYNKTKFYEEVYSYVFQQQAEPDHAL